MKVYNLKELKSVLDLSREEILQLLKEDKLSGRKFGDEWEITERQLREYLELKEDEREKMPNRFW